MCGSSGNAVLGLSEAGYGLHWTFVAVLLKAADIKLIADDRLIVLTHLGLMAECYVGKWRRRHDQKHGVIPHTSLWPHHLHESAQPDGLSMGAGCYVLMRCSSSNCLHSVDMPQILMSFPEHIASAHGITS